MFAVKILPDIEIEVRKLKGRDFSQQQKRLPLELVDACLLITCQARWLYKRTNAPSPGQKGKWLKDTDISTLQKFPS